MPILPAAAAQTEFSFPLVVIGGGACGLVAALSAREKGLEVLVLERDARPTGSTSLSAGLIPAAGTKLQRQHGVEDSAALFAADLMAKAKGQSDPVVTHAVAAASGELVDWLMESQGLDLHLLEGFLFPGHSVFRMHGPPNQTGSELETGLLAACGRAGIDIMTHAQVTDLYATDDRRIVAVRFRRPDGSHEVVGCQAVILACNGYGGNPEMVARFIPSMKDADFSGHVGNTGDAVTWGMELGAGTADLGGFQGHGSVALPHNIPMTWAVITRGGIQVNVRGERFANEMRGYSEHAEEVLRQPEQFAWDIFDAECETSAVGFHDYRRILELGGVKSAATVEELAGVTGLPLEALRRTLVFVDKCARGTETDPLGRDFTTTPPLSPPYRAVKVKGALFHTQGGLVVDAGARVLDQKGKAFPNLFAGGGAARGLSGPSSWGYLSGNGLLSATVLGRIAGLGAVELLRGR